MPLELHEGPAEAAARSSDVRPPGSQARPPWWGLTHAQRTPQPESADSPAAGGSGPAASRPWPGGPGLGGPGPVVVSTHSTTPCRRANQRQDQSEHGQPEEQGSEGRASDPRLRSLSLGLTPLDLLPETIKEWF